MTGRNYSANRGSRRALAGLLLAGLVLAGAVPAGGADEPPEELTAEQRARLEKEARTLNRQMVELCKKGQLPEAARVLTRVATRYERLYPAARYPGGHPRLAFGLDNLGFLLFLQGEHGRALSYYERALAMRLKLYPASRFPDGHPELAQSLTNLGRLFHATREFQKALPYHERAWPCTKSSTRRRASPPATSGWSPA